MWKSIYTLLLDQIPLDRALRAKSPKDLEFNSSTVDAQVQSRDPQIPLEQFPACRQLKSVDTPVFNIHILYTFMFLLWTVLSKALALSIINSGVPVS